MPQWATTAHIPLSSSCWVGKFVPWLVLMKPTATHTLWISPKTKPLILASYSLTSPSSHFEYLWDDTLSCDNHGEVELIAIQAACIKDWPATVLIRVKTWDNHTQDKPQVWFCPIRLPKGQDPVLHEQYQPIAQYAIWLPLWPIYCSPMIRLL